ncbi:GDP-mannose 4,6-dehydratase [Acidimicrobiaceae bacterium]|nr:GDP-mannose 4,6-dehydratase [Acidimicrobiaceae bacterium]
MKVLITGCFGFIGYNFLKTIQKKYENEMEIIGIDALKLPTSKINSKTKFSNFKFYEKDLNDIHELEIDNLDLIVNFAAESHVDNSISSPISFINSNTKGVGNLLFWALKNNVEKIIHVSTDEVYGSLETDFPNEDSMLNPSSPYSASKASAEHICSAFSKTYGQNIIMVRPSNNYGIYQQPEKLIPFSIANIIHEKNIEIYGEGKNIRHWLNVEDTCSAILKIVDRSAKNETYNIGSGEYFDNIYVAKKILEILKLDESRITFVEDRLGHDFRYAVNFEKLKKLDWEPIVNFDEELEKIINWYIKNKEWWIESYNKILLNRQSRNKLSN